MNEEATLGSLPQLFVPAGERVTGIRSREISVLIS